MVTRFPTTSATPGSELWKLTGRPLEAVAVRVKGGSPTRCAARGGNSSVCPARCTTRGWETPGAGSRFPDPDWEALMSAFPAPVMLSTLPLTWATCGFELVKVRARPLQALALSSKGGSP